MSEKYECQHCNYANIFRTPIICPDNSSSSAGGEAERDREREGERETERDGIGMVMGRSRHRCEWYKRDNNGLTGKGELMMPSPTMAAVDEPDP